MDLGKFRELTKNFADNYELVISNTRDREDFATDWASCYTKESKLEDKGENKKYYCYITPIRPKQTFKEFLFEIKELFLEWFEGNIDEKTRDEIMFWIQPIGSFAALDISLRGMAGLPIWHRAAWYNLHLLLFKIRGRFNWLSKDMQAYYNALEEYKKEKKAR